MNDMIVFVKGMWWQWVLICHDMSLVLIFMQNDKEENKDTVRVPYMFDMLWSDVLVLMWFKGYFRRRKSCFYSWESFIWRRGNDFELEAESKQFLDAE
jgi:hypothetical protein